MKTLLDHPVPTLPPPPPSQRRFGVRAPNWSKRTYRILGVIAGVIFVAAMWLFYFSSIFALESLVVEGVRTIQPSEVAARADLGAGTPLARVDQSAVESRVAGIPAVRSVTVSRRWPNIIVISIVERERVGFVKNGDKFDVLDKQGYPFEHLKKQPKNLPLIEAPDEASRSAAVTVAGALPPKVLARTASVSATDPMHVLVKTTNGVTVTWGSPEDSPYKAKVLAALLSKTDDKWIDVRFPSSPSSAQQSPKPAPPPTPDPTPTPEVSGQPSPTVSGQAAVEGEAIPQLPGVVPQSITPVRP